MLWSWQLGAPRSCGWSGQLNTPKDFYPERAVVLAVFTEEEGARFRVPCLGSRLMTGTIAPETARALTDDDGITLAAAMTAAGCDASLIGPRPDLLDGMAA